jgi:hypothetical protein
MDYYDDSEPSGEQGSAQGAADRESDSGKTALIDSNICPGMKPGDEFTVRVEKVLDSGEYEISYPGGKDEESSESTPDNEMAEGESSQPQSEMAGYME